jgi:hypothetical protein
VVFSFEDSLKKAPRKAIQVTEQILDELSSLAGLSQQPTEEV